MGDMQNILLQYMESRIGKQPVPASMGPVVTISREYGCPAKLVATSLVDQINRLIRESGRTGVLWRWIGKDLLDEAATELNVDKRHIRHVFNYENRSIMDEILAATRKDGSYKTDKKIRKTIGSVIRNIGERGHVVIVGRGGVAMTRHIPESLHVRLIAPMDWRIRWVMDMQGLSQKVAEEKILKIDEKRKKFLEYFLGESCCGSNFDLVLNCATFNNDTLTEILLQTLIIRKLM